MLSDKSAGSRHGAVRECFENWIAREREGLLRELERLIVIDSHSPRESATHGLLIEQFGSLGASFTREVRNPELQHHPACTPNPYLDLPASERCALRVQLPLCGAPRRTLFSAHVDVVPPGPAFPDAFVPSRGDGTVCGRGAVDTKGNIIMLLGALRFFADCGMPRGREVEIDFVNEEEIGGNGALSTLMWGRDADDFVVLEPTSLEVFHGHRGCLEFAATLVGQAVHMGSRESGDSAIDEAIAFIHELREIEARLVAEARSDPDFCDWESPLQVNVGMIAGGEWPGSIPERCSVRGNFGFLPSMSLADVRKLLEITVAGVSSSAESTISCDGIRNEAYKGDPRSALADSLREATEAAGVPQKAPRGWNVSCDARLYHHLTGRPTVVFGAGSLSEAHSSHETLSVREWERGMHALVLFLCGAAS